jgi:hypothetical protein
LRRSSLAVHEIGSARTPEHVVLANHNLLCQTYFRKGHS